MIPLRIVTAWEDSDRFRETNATRNERTRSSSSAADRRRPCTPRTTSPPRGIRSITGTSYTAANALVARFVSAGILHEATGYRRNRLFRYEPYISLSTDDAGP